MDERTKDQNETVVRYIKRGLSKSTLVLPTGYGKGRVAVEISKAIRPQKIIILSDRIEIRDNVWKAEFKKWGMEKFYRDNIYTATYQAAVKWDWPSDVPDTLVILDEVDAIAGTEVLSEVINLFDWATVLGLTGFVTASKRSWFEENLPIAEEYTYEYMKDKGFLNRVKYVFIQYELSKEKSVVVEYTQGKAKRKYMTSETIAYNKAESYIEKLEADRMLLKMSMSDDSVHNRDDTFKLESLEKRMDSAVFRRNETLQNLSSSVRIVKKTIASIREMDKTGKIVTFSIATKQADKLCHFSYHTKSIKASESRLKKFIKGTIKELAVCGKIDRGSNIPELRHGIWEGFYSSDTTFQQRRGRLLRLDPDDFATVFILLPYYRKKDNNGDYSLHETAQVGWAKKMLKGVDISSNKIIDYRRK